MCGGALSLSRRAGTLCRLLFPITGVQPSFSSHMNLIPWTSSFYSYSTAVHAFRSTACSTDSESWSLWSASGGERIEVLLSLRSAGWNSANDAEDKAWTWSTWGALIIFLVSCLAVQPIGMAAAVLLVRVVVPDFLFSPLLFRFLLRPACPLFLTPYCPHCRGQKDIENLVAVCFAVHWVLSIESPCYCNNRQIDRGTPVLARSACKPSTMQQKWVGPRMPKGQLSTVPWPRNSRMPLTFQPALQALQQHHKYSHSLQSAIHTHSSQLFTLTLVSYSHSTT